MQLSPLIKETFFLQQMKRITQSHNWSRPREQSGHVMLSPSLSIYNITPAPIAQEHQEDKAESWWEPEGQDACWEAVTPRNSREAGPSSLNNTTA